MTRRRVCSVERAARGPGRLRGDRGDPGVGAARLRADNERLRAENERLRAENERLAERVRSLEARVEELLRAAKRQAAPFSRGEPKRDPGRGGRRPGAAYGRDARRPVPER